MAFTVLYLVLPQIIWIINQDYQRYETIDDTATGRHFGDQ